jgi:acyl carrier protein
VDTIEGGIRTMIAQITGLSADIAVDANLYLDLGVASVHALTLLTQLEEQFDIRIPDEDFVEATSISKLTLLVGSVAGKIDLSRQDA